MKSKYKLDFEEVLGYLRRFIKDLSTKGIYIVLLLFYAYKNDNTPAWAKNIILGAMAYFISPIDAIPDLTPFLGMTDDLGVLSFGLVTIACYIDSSVREKAITKIKIILGDNLMKTQLDEVDSWL